ncbi:MAG TPA: hypothetical protein PKJ63_02045 [Cyclobacteriaceae bacterium]|nr:hypothetical protein [Cyclobacteriaceae bacterium]
MSDFSLLYKKYNSVSNLTNDLNNSVITLKRRKVSNIKEYRDKHPKLEVTEDELIKANTLLLAILSLLENFYKEQDTKNELYELMDNALFQNQILKNVVFKSEIANTLAKLKSNKDLSEKDLANIDKFISILDNEAAVLFRKLRTSRG